MFFKKLFGVSAFAATIAVSLCAGAPAALGGSPSTVEVPYAPVQSISYDFGSKSMRGYFVRNAAMCIVMLMVFEKGDPEQSPLTSATRVRLLLSPGQIAGLDSEEGRSLNFTCGEGATTLIVDAGERDQLMDLQALALRKTAAD